MTVKEGYKLLKYAGFTDDAANRISIDYNKANKMDTLVRLFYKDGGYKDYYIMYRDSASNYIAKAMERSITENKPNGKFVIGGKLMN